MLVSLSSIFFFSTMQPQFPLPQSHAEPPLLSSPSSNSPRRQSLLQSASRPPPWSPGNHCLSAAAASARSPFSSLAAVPPSINAHQPCHQETSSLSRLLSSVAVRGPARSRRRSRLLLALGPATAAAIISRSATAPPLLHVQDGAIAGTTQEPLPWSFMLEQPSAVRFSPSAAFGLQPLLLA